MSICTMNIPDCGPLGTVEVTISFKYWAAMYGNKSVVAIHWIKVGGEDGVEIDIDDNYVHDVIKPYCAEFFQS